MLPGDADQEIAVLLVPETVAENCCVWVGNRLAVVGETATETEPPPPPPLPPLPQEVSVTSKEAAIKMVRIVSQRRRLLHRIVYEGSNNPARGIQRIAIPLSVTGRAAAAEFGPMVVTVSVTGWVPTAPALSCDGLNEQPAP